AVARESATGEGLHGEVRVLARWGAGRAPGTTRHFGERSRHRFGRQMGLADEHTPVLLEEALAALAIETDGYYVDATFGRGGHTARILQALGREGRVLA